MPFFSQNQQEDPIEQLLYACFHSRKALDRIDEAIYAQFPKPRKPTPKERNQIRTRQETPESLRLQDTLFWTPYGHSLHTTQHNLRQQLATIAKQYVSLGIEERRTRSMEAWASVLIPLFDAISSDPTLSLNRYQQSVLPQVVEHHLRVIEGGQASTTQNLTTSTTNPTTNPTHEQQKEQIEQVAEMAGIQIPKNKQKKLYG